MEVLVVRKLVTGMRAEGWPAVGGGRQEEEGRLWRMNRKILLPGGDQTSNLWSTNSLFFSVSGSLNFFHCFVHNDTDMLCRR